MSSHLKDRLFRGYGPLIGFAAIFLAVVLLVPSQVPDGDDVEGRDGSSVMDQLGDGDSADEDGLAFEDGVDPETGEPLAEGTSDDLAGGGDLGDSSTGGGPGGSSGGNGPGGPGGSGGPGGPGGPGAGPPKVAGCGAAQVQGDPYSPICIQFSGNNGGATSKGVTGDKIKVTVRLNGLNNGLVDAVAGSVSRGANLPADTPDKIQRTITGIAEYFNKRFQFYGRKLEVVTYNGKGNVLDEIIGGGQEGAQADALKASKEHNAFAEVAAISAPYASALSQQKVINIGAPYVSRNWLRQRAPYSWTPLTDCTTVVEATAGYYATKMHGKPAVNAGGPLKGQTRKVAVIAPDNAEYQECVQAGLGLLRKRGIDSNQIRTHKYRLSTSPGSWVKDILPKLRGDGINSVLCGCDPLFLQFLTAEMNKSGYFPEMLVAGVALVDNDLVGQIMDQNVWRHAFGVSFGGNAQPLNASLGYRAYKSVRPDEPALMVDLIYQQFYMLAIGIQMAGPNLNPGSFQKGMFDYPTKSGPYGRWGFAPGDYSTSDDAHEIFWNPGQQSPVNRVAGAYVDSNGGKRFPIGQWPKGQPRSAAP